MRAVFGIDVSKVSSEVAILVNGEKVHGYTMPNDAIGFARLLGDLKTLHKPEIVFEATGVYSRRLQAFLDEHGYAYTRLNPLEAKKQLDSLRVRKTDQIDAEKLAQSQFVLSRKPTYVQEEVYQNLRDLSRFYQNLTSDTMNLVTSSLRNTLPNVAIPTLERFCSSAFIISLQLVTPILAISQTFMRNEKDNRKRLLRSHTRLPPYIVSFGQCITS